ncbi:transmembrane protein 177 [Tribolium castaneum]|uniref:Transmembrane protein 177-like Protein n=1 Tax=Tribolium castaneum TaxID=7070 RepID=D6X335_TRICA|nr:PREDICTED: transmembrane protein 177 [Tribolium castaneum]EFA10319.1 Transmembrane protein 177-like Protein [Tribolium castaneum]|eukprot:XP_969653.1 PREDICTED: transmembrane protein 177 [Tribolium castaneum]
MSLWNRLSHWLLTETGKKACYYAAGATTSVILLAHTLPQTIFLSQYEDLFHLYKHGFSVPLTEKVQKRFEKALDLLEVEHRDRHLYKPFAAYGFDIFSAGTSYSKFGVRVGIPTHFFYDDESSVDKSSIKIRDESVIWESDEGKLLLKSLVLSENAQIYAMAREIKMRDTLKGMLDTVVAVVSWSGMYGISNTLNIKFDLYSKPRPVRIIMYCLVGAFSFGSYVFCKDFSQVYYETQIDKELKEKNPVFAEGGKEFYNKIVARNIALRKMLGKEGERAYTALGNDNYLFRYRHVPVVQRKLFFEGEKA